MNLRADAGGVPLLQAAELHGGFADGDALDAAHFAVGSEQQIELALERGEVGRSYIVGGENMSMGAFLAALAAATGLPAPKLQVPRSLALGVGALSQLVEGRILRREPFAALEAARMSTTNMMFSDARARNELGYKSRPACEAMADAARWFAENGYVKPKRLQRMQIRPGG